MTSLSELSQKILNKYGIENQKDFYYILLISGILCFVGSFTATYVSLDIQHLPTFKGDLASWDFTMPCLGGALSTLIFSKIHKKFFVKDILSFSFIGLFLFSGGMIFWMNTLLDFPLRFLIGFFSGIVFLEIACFEAELFKPPYRGLFFSFVCMFMSFFSFLGSFFVDYFRNSVQVFGISMAGIFICYVFIFMWRNPSDDKKIITKNSSENPEDSLSFNQRKSVFFLIFTSVLMIASVEGAISSYLAIFFEGTGLNEGEAILASSFSSLGVIILMPIAGWIGDNCGYEKAFLTIISICLVSVIMAFFFTQQDIYSFLFFIIKGSTKAFMSLMYAWVATQYVKKSLSSGMSLFSFLQSISYILSPLGVGFLMRSYGNNGFLFWILGALSISFILMLFQLKLIKS